MAIDWIYETERATAHINAVLRCINELPDVQDLAAKNLRLSEMQSHLGELHGWCEKQKAVTEPLTRPSTGLKKISRSLRNKVPGGVQ